MPRPCDISSQGGIARDAYDSSRAAKPPCRLEIGGNMAQVIEGEGREPLAAGAGLGRDVLGLEAASWLAGSGASGDPRANRHFLAVFAVYLVKQFREEEALLRHANRSAWSRRRRANQCLARQLRALMVAVDLGLDATAGIRAFLGAWQAHRPLTDPAGAAEGWGWH